MKHRSPLALASPAMVVAALWTRSRAGYATGAAKATVGTKQLKKIAGPLRVKNASRSGAARAARAVPARPAGRAAWRRPGAPGPQGPAGPTGRNPAHLGAPR